MRGRPAPPSRRPDLAPARGLHRAPALGPVCRAIPPPTTSPCCPTPPAPPAIPRAACTRTSHAARLQPAASHGLEAACTATSVFLAVAPLFHMLGLQNGMNMPMSLGATVGDDAALESGEAARADRAPSRDGLDRAAGHADRLLRASRGRAARPVQPGPALGRWRGHAGGRGRRCWQERFGLQLQRGLRPDRDRVLPACQPAGARQAPVPGHCRPRASTRASSTRRRCGNCRPAKWASWYTRPAGHARLLAQPEADAAAFVELDGKRFFRTGDLA